MTASEAIKELHGIRPRGGIIPQKRAEALDVAIQALEKVDSTEQSAHRKNVGRRRLSRRRRSLYLITTLVTRFQNFIVSAETQLKSVTI